MRIGIIGYGAVAALHVKGLHAWAAEVPIVCGPNIDKARAFAATNAVQGATSESNAVVDACDAIIIASPTPHHFEQALAVLRAGRHCLVELPACSSVAEARALSDAATASEVSLQCAHTSRFLRGVQHVGDFLNGSGVGEMRHIFSIRAIPPRARSWVDSAILHHAAHHIDLLLHWFGSLTPLACVAHPQFECAQDAALLAALENGAPITVNVSYTSKLQETGLTLVGSEHTIATDGFSYVQSDNGAILWRGDAQESYEAAIQEQDRAFVESCSGSAAGVSWQNTVRLALCLDAFRNVSTTI